MDWIPQDIRKQRRSDEYLFQERLFGAPEESTEEVVGIHQGLPRLAYDPFSLWFRSFQ